MEPENPDDYLRQLFSNERQGERRRQPDAKSWLETRRTIDEVFSFEGLSASPAWDLLLFLYANGTSTLADAAKCGAFSHSTGMRWIAVLESKELIVEVGDEGGSLRVDLTSDASHMVEVTLASRPVST